MTAFPSHPAFASRGTAGAVPVTFVSSSTWGELRTVLDAHQRAFADAAGFEPRPGRPAAAARRRHARRRAVRHRAGGRSGDRTCFLPGRLPGSCPPGIYRFANAPHDARLAALAFALGAYRFTRYRKTETSDVRLDLPHGVDGDELTRIAEGVALARDLINTPANDMGPAELEEAARRACRRGTARRSARSSATTC